MKKEKDIFKIIHEKIQENASVALKLNALADVIKKQNRPIKSCFEINDSKMDLEKKQLQTIDKIIENQSIVTELNGLLNAFRAKNGGVKIHMLSNEDYREYGIEKSGLIGGVLAEFLALKRKEDGLPMTVFIVRGKGSGLSYGCFETKEKAVEKMNSSAFPERFYIDEVDKG